MLQSGAACLPVTALQVLQCHHEVFILVGQGPWLRVYDQAGTQHVNQSIFDSQPIHGIELIAEYEPRTLPFQFNIVVWGGRWVRYGILNIESRADQFSFYRLTVNLKPKFDAQDWVLKAAMNQSSALDSSEASVTSTFMLTSHNTLLEVGQKVFADSDLLSHDIVLKIQGPQTFLYSADINVVDANYIIIASGTVFGEIVTWTCQRANYSESWVSILRNRYNGHRGSVFGVNISPPLTLNGSLTRLMASCSDDRTIRVWDIGDCDQSSPVIDSKCLPVQTGFGSTSHREDLQLAATWGHASRIWDILFDIRQNISGQNEVFLLSRGEDATCQLWSLKMGIDMQANQPFVLNPLMQDRHHNGKNIWSFTQIRTGSSMKVYTGGADGQLSLRTIGDGETSFSHTSKSFKEITRYGKALRLYTFMTHEECLATTEYGELFLVSTKRVSAPLSWVKMLDSDSKSSFIMCHLRKSQLVLLGRQNGSLAILQFPSRQLIPLSASLPAAIAWIHTLHEPDPVEGLSTCMIACLANRQAFILWLQVTTPLEIEMASLTLPETFTVTASCYEPVTKTLILGSRAGALALYFGISKSTEPAVSSSCFRHVHGEDCITSLKILGAKSETESGVNGTMHILTTGRDGCYAVHSISWDSTTRANQPHFSTLHISSPPFGPNIEGAYFTSSGMKNNTKPFDLILYGFRSTSFVVWNETQQCTLYSVDCGGSHRSWCYTDSGAQIDSKGVQTTDPGPVPQDAVRAFVWTQAGNFNWASLRGSSPSFIVKGGHGREIKAIASCGRSYECNSQSLPMVATGAEDTNIQLFILSIGLFKNPDDTLFQPLAVLKGHTAGLQHLCFSPSGRYLFSSAGCEEFFVWRLTFNVPCIDVGVVLQDQMPKEDEDFDARIMSFDLRDISDNSSVEARHKSAYLITLGYSNGKVKIVQYTPAGNRGQGRFEKLKEIQYGSFCLMQTCFPSDHMQPGTELFSSYILSAGSNGCLNICTFNLTDIRTVQPSIEVSRVHQSSILSMDTVSLLQGSWLTATGGDDNALGLTIVSPAASSSVPNATSTRSLRIPKAHAAALTALKIARVKRTIDGFELTIISVGNDQRVKIWIVNVSDFFLDNTTDKLIDGFRVKRGGAVWTTVADVSAIELVERLEDDALQEDEHQIPIPKKCRMMIVGVGMELLDVDLDPN